jgi:hypothetical protein
MGRWPENPLPFQFAFVIDEKRRTPNERSSPKIPWCKPP